jgi:hypothetical protein
VDKIVVHNQLYKLYIAVTYVLKDDSGKELKGSFYEQELKKVGNKQNYRVVRIIDERHGPRGTEYLVKWYGYNASFKNWVSNVTRYKD